MKNFYERAKELADNCLLVKNNNVYKTLGIEFKISERIAGDRFKSLFNMSIRDYININTTPTKEEMIDYIIKYDTSEEAYYNSKVRYTNLWSKYLQLYFGTSNFFKIKNSLIYSKKIPKLIPRREDNESIIFSQILGDGYIERHNSLKIEHCEKQYEYLKFKIDLINNAYPYTNGYGHIRKRVQDFKNTGKLLTSYSYRTGECLKYVINKYESKTLKEVINSMTPLGIMLLYLDDGSLVQSYNKNYYITTLSISTINQELQIILQEYFNTYGLSFNIDKSKGVLLQNKKDIISFIQIFILPYKDIIPKEMRYKFDYKDIVEI